MSFAAYLAGCAALAIAFASAATIGVVGRRRLTPALAGPAGWVAAIVLAVAAAILPALLLGSFGILTGWGWLVLLVATAALLWRFRDRLPRSGPDRPALSPGGPEAPPRGQAVMTGIALAIAAAAFGVFAAGTWLKLGTGMSVFDTNWYHGPLAVEMARTGSTLELHQLTPAFLSWFYPQNSEIVHTLGILIFGNDLLSPFINLAWFGGCLIAAWAIGRPYGAAPVSLAGTALILGSAIMSDQAGEARNDIVGTFFVLAAVAILVNGAAGGRRVGVGTAVVVALAAGLAAGTKINFIPAGAILAGAAIWMTGPEIRRRMAGWILAAALLGGGYWYLRNLIHSGNPLPWVKHLGPITLPGPGQETGGRQAGSVFGYLTDLEVIRHWFFSGLHRGLGSGWPVVFLLALAGPVACLWRRSDPARRAGALAALALFAAWLFAPTSASGYPGIPGGFLTGLRYLAPALAVGMALLGSGVASRGRGLGRTVMGLLVLLAPFTIGPAAPFPSFRYWILAALAGIAFWVIAVAFAVLRRGTARTGRQRSRSLARGSGAAALALAAVVAILAGQVIQRHYFEHRYTSAASYTTRGLAHAFVWARGIEGERIGTTASREYPLFGTTLGNEVGYIGEQRPRGGFVKPGSCRAFREAVNRGDYRYLVLAVDRITPDLAFPPEARWVAGDSAARPIYRGEGTVIYRLDGPLDPAGCP